MLAEWDRSQNSERGLWSQRYFTTMNYVHLLGESVAKLSRSFNLNPFTEDEQTAKEVIPFKRKA
jgi:hypothetical protein